MKEILDAVLTAPRPSDVGIDAAAHDESTMAIFARWVRNDLAAVPDETYSSIWHWSTAEPESYWRAVIDFFGLPGLTTYPATQAVPSRPMPGGSWFPQAEVNFTEEVFRSARRSEAAVICVNEVAEARTWSWDELEQQTASLASWMRQHGVGPGDRVVAYLGNRIEAIVGFLATAAVGAVWSICNQDVSPEGAVARFAQLEPKVIVTTGGYVYGGRYFDRQDALRDLVSQLPTIEHVILAPPAGHRERPHLDGRPVCDWLDLTREKCELVCTQVPFNDALWVLFSSGTTGAPKGIVHSQGGILLQMLNSLGLHLDVRARDVMFWYCSTSWVMWNMQISCLLLGATAVLYDGNPGFPGVDQIWQLAKQHQVTLLGVSPGLLATAAKDKVDLARLAPTSLRTLGCTGAPLPASTASWVTKQLADGVRLNVLSGGTDVCSAFVGGNPLDPVPPAGEMGPSWLGTAAAAWNEDGEPVVDHVGELVVTAPMPGMPIGLYGDDDDHRLRETYFSTYEGVWRQGDWATFTSRGTTIIHGRSDATLNRQGVRLGTSEIYAAVEALPEVHEALVVGVELPNGQYWMPMFVHLAAGVELDGDLEQRLRQAIRERASPRHVPDSVIEVPGLPHTMTGKRLEVPVKRLLLGHPAQVVVTASAVDRPDLLEHVANAGRRFREAMAEGS